MDEERTRVCSAFALSSLAFRASGGYAKGVVQEAD